MSFLRLKNIFWTPFVAAMVWTKAMDLASEGKFKEALEKILILENLNVIPLRTLFLKSFLLDRLSQNQECLKTLEKASSQIEKEKLNLEEKKYLKTYANLIRQSVERKLNVEKVSAIEEINYEEIELKKVSTAWIQNFPLRDHPDWAENRKRVF